MSTYRQCINTVALTNPDGELIYFIYFFILSWVLPILVMTVCYVSIIITICRRTKKNILGRRMSKYRKIQNIQELVLTTIIPKYSVVHFTSLNLL